MINNTPKISIIIPAYNAEKFLPNLLKSIDNLFYENYEIIFIDDGSQDKTFEILSKYCHLNKKAKVHHIANHGECFARNVGISLAKGEYIYFGDADDVLHPDIFNTLLAGITQDGCDLSICSFWPIFGPKYKLKNLKKPRRIHNWKVIDGWENVMKYYLPKSACYGFTWRKLFKHSILKKIKFYPNIFPTDVGFCHDAIVTFNYLCHVRKMAVTQRKRYYYRINNQNATHNMKLEKAITIRKAVDVIENYDWSKFPKLNKYVKISSAWFSFFFIQNAIKAQYTDSKVLEHYFNIYKNGIKYFWTTKISPITIRFQVPLKYFKIKTLIKRIKDKK